MHSNIFNITIASIRVITKPRQELWRQWWQSLDLWEGLSMALWSDASKDRLVTKNVLDSCYLSAISLPGKKTHTEFDQNCCSISTRWTGSSSVSAFPASPASVSSSVFVSPTSSAWSSSSPFSSASSASPPTRSSSSWLSRTPTPWTPSYPRWSSIQCQHYHNSVQGDNALAWPDLQLCGHPPWQQSLLAGFFFRSIDSKLLSATLFVQKILSFLFLLLISLSRWKLVEFTLARTKSLHLTTLRFSTSSWRRPPSFQYSCPYCLTPSWREAKRMKKIKDWIEDGIHPVLLSHYGGDHLHLSTLAHIA